MYCKFLELAHEFVKKVVSFIRINKMDNRINSMDNGCLTRKALNVIEVPKVIYRDK